jgi:hypothetical protein
MSYKSPTCQDPMQLLQGGSTLAVGNGGVIGLDAGAVLDAAAGFMSIGQCCEPIDQTGAQTIASNGTITLSTTRDTIRLTAAGSVTGIVMTPGTLDGQKQNLLNISADSITFGAEIVSFVADGTSAVLLPNRRMEMQWSGDDSVWFH